MQETALQYEYFSSVTQRKVEWLWYPYIPYGKLTILQGDPGEGKSTFMLSIASLLTRGLPMPDGYRVPEPRSVVYQTAEDNLADTVKPRLLAAGADCDKIAYIVDDDNSLTLEDNRIEQIIRGTQAKLFILDPLQAYLSSDTDMFNPGRIRQQLKKLSDIASKHNCAIVIVGHMNKASGEKNLYRGLGSIDIAAIARSVLMITRDKDDPQIRYMFPVKSSLAPEGAIISFRLNAKKGVEWVDSKTVHPELLEYCSSIKNKLLRAERIIYELLKSHDMCSSDIIKKLQLMGISARTAQSAKKALGVSSYRKGGLWYWYLPENKEQKAEGNE